MVSRSAGKILSRREFLRTSGCGFGSVALAAMCTEQAWAAGSPLTPKAPHFAAKAKRVIFMWMAGGPSQVDMFDYKPRLVKENGDPLPFELPSNRNMAGGIVGTRLMGPIASFSRQGQSGLMMTDMLPHLARHADELCVLNAMEADSEAHAPAARQLHTGATQFLRPSLGSWVAYGLGAENQDLPGFITVCPQLAGDTGTVQLFGNAFLPASFQGTPIGKADTGAKDADIRYLEDHSIPPNLQRHQIDLIQQMNHSYLEKMETDRQMEGVIESFELAFRMQSEAPELIDLSNESKVTLDLYGVDDEETENFGRQCLLARRFAEAGVRFIQITDNGWDHHSKIRSGLPKRCYAVDKPIAGLITDLKARGLFDDTLLVWSGEFGRTPYFQDLSEGKDGPESYGRGHNPYGFCAWMAGGGVRGGLVHGVSDEYGFSTVDQKVHIHDLHATILHLLGLDHKKLTYRYSGRDFRLTDVYGRVVKEILV